MHFNDLNDDVIEMIFYNHIWVNLQTKFGLLLTCRRWYTVAVNFNPLWSKIWLGCNPSLPSSKVLVGNVDGLLHAIERAGNAPFDLRLASLRRRFKKELNPRLGSIVEKDWMSRCRSLTFRFPDGPCPKGDDLIFKELISNANFEALETITWTHYSNVRLEDLYSTLLARAECSAPRLSTLSLEYKFKYGNPPVFFPPQHVGIFGRIRRLDVHHIIQPVPWSLFPELEHLDYHCRDRPDQTGLNLHELFAPNLTSLRLGGCILLSDFPKKEIFRQLKRLVLNDCSLANGQPPFPSSFPSLTYLGCQSYGKERDPCLYLISAENLDELVISNLRIWPCPKLGNITPRILRLDISFGDDKYHDFMQPRSVWSKVEELHLDLYLAGRGIPPTLANALAGPAPDPFPRLRVLTAWAGSTILSFRQTPIQHMRAIAARRRDGGYPPFKRLELGWQMMYYTHHGNLPFEESCVTHWTDCLQD